MPTSRRTEIYEAVIRKMVTQALEAQEEKFEREHMEDSADMLLGYLRGCAAELGYVPRYKEVVGWRLIELRFGSWNVALQLAGLPAAARCPANQLPRILVETEKQKELYRRRKAEKKQKSLQRMKEQARRKKEYTRK